MEARVFDAQLLSIFFFLRRRQRRDDQGIRGGELLKLEEVETILRDVKTDNIKVFRYLNCEFSDFMVVATGQSAWHVRNIAQALIYKVKKKQKGSKRMYLPSVEGQEGGTGL